MRILAVDTCAKSCSVAVTDAGCLEGEVFTRRRQTHSRHLMRMVDMVLEISGMTMGEIDAFAVTRGPGSFTGLRIGISAVKGMALAGRKPVVGVSSLEALAWPMAMQGGLVCAILDAGKGEVYSASYRFPEAPSRGDAASPPPDPSSRTISDERALSPQDLLAGISGPCTFVGDGVRAYAGMIADRMGNLARFPSDEHHDIRASAAARLALLRLNRGGGDGVDVLVPRYIRRSDAELGLGKAQAP
ncbi:tRNA (adenosine(37)-N6)-threonylcarbamoyltransferase complex dimerization subunit type 1 TsaB [Desulfococcus sp.]|uniref:tRNA (adenosine(37)-N6)-threonylcarbamoyltransferase complex dimerization subunit type 1 TsaB n=1 Tax=Desulfococcus sp. TaxID=2025834 RepID=UPI003594842B